MTTRANTRLLAGCRAGTRTGMRACLRIGVYACLMLGGPAATPARSQETAQAESMREVLSFLITNQAVVTDDFVRDRQAAEATRDTVSHFLQVELAALPISSSAGGFVYRFNPALGTVERASDSFGPFLVERALTSGQGRASIGVSYRHTRYERLDGRNLRDGSLVTTANRLANETAPFDLETLTLELDANTFTLLASAGVTDRLDVGAAVPFVDLRLSGERRNVYRGEVFQQAEASARASGLADIALRAKYQIVQTRLAGLAVDADVRLPTGDPEQLLGTGETGLQLSLAASVEGPRVASHLRAGFARGGVSDALALGGAVVLAATPRASLVFEVFGRRLRELPQIDDATAPHPTIPNVQTMRLLPAAGEGTNTGLVLGGFKWNVVDTWLLNGNVQFPLTEAGLSGEPTFSIALDYAFGL